MPPTFKRPALKKTKPTAPPLEEGEGKVVSSTLQGVDLTLNEKVYSDFREEFADHRAALRIDRNALDDCIVHQPELYHRVSEALVECVAQRDTAKDRLAATDATVAQHIREKWTKSGERYSETRVGDAVQLDPTHILAYEEWGRLSRRAAYIGTLKDAYEQRGKMLRELTALYISGYFSKATHSSTENKFKGATASVARDLMNQHRQNRREDD